MNKNTKIVWGIAIVLLIVSSIIPMFTSHQNTNSLELGQLHQNTKLDPADLELAATYKEEPIPMDNVNYFYNQRVSSGLFSDLTKRQVADEMITNILLYEEAVSRGLSPTEEQLEAEIAMMQENYNKHAKLRRDIDEFCEGAQMTSEEYWADIKESTEQALARQALREQFDKDWCAERGLDPDDLEEQEDFDALEAAWDAFGQELLRAHAVDITYYLPEE